jgi:hypothetical protein
VYLATTGNGELRAVKIFSPHQANGLELDSFNEKINFMPKLVGVSGLPRFYGGGTHVAGKDKHHYPFYITDFISGNVIDDLKPNLSDRLTLCVRIAYHCAHTLIGLEEKQITHLGISPRKLMETYEGNIIVVGLSNCVINNTPTLDRLRVMDTAYMTPEQILKKPIDHRTAMYALGVTIASIMHQEDNTPPRPYDTQGMLDRTKNFEPGFARLFVGKNRSANALEEIVKKMTREDKDDRYPSMQDIIDHVRPLYRSITRRQYHVSLDLAQLVTDALDRHIPDESFATLVKRKYGIIVVPQGTFDAVKTDPQSYASKTSPDLFLPPCAGQTEWVLGRSKRNANIALLEGLSGNSKAKDRISRVHALIEKRSDGSYVISNKSRNGTGLQKARGGFDILHDESDVRILESNQLIKIGQEVWEFYTPHELRGFISEREASVSARLRILEDSAETQVMRLPEL